MKPISALSSTNLLANPAARTNKKNRRGRVQSLDILKQKSTPLFPPLVKQPLLVQMHVLSRNDSHSLKQMKGNVIHSHASKRGVSSSFLQDSSSLYTAGSDSNQYIAYSTPRQQLRSCGSFSNLFQMKSSLQMGKDPWKKNKVEIFNYKKDKPVENSQMVVIQLFSNHGSPEKTQISSITLLDPKNNPIPVLQAGIVIPHGTKEYCLRNGIQLYHKKSESKTVQKKDPYHVTSLFDGLIVKTKDNPSLFSIPFPLPLIPKIDDDDPITKAKKKQLLSDTISLILIVDMSYQIDGTRLFNTSFDSDAGINDINVKLTAQNYEEAFQVPKMFGVDHKFEKGDKKTNLGPFMSSVLVPEEQQPESVLRDLFPDSFQVADTLKDDYGEYPFPQTQSLQFEILQTFAENDPMIGLNGIEIYNDSLDKITMDDIKSVVIKNSISKNAKLSVLLKEKMITSDDSDMFVIERSIRKRFNLSLNQSENDNVDEIDICGNPLMTFIFKKPMKLTKIIIWNYNSCTESNLRGISKASIKLDGRPFWTGIVKKSGGCISNMEKNATHIWMHDLKNIRALQELEFLSQCTS